MSYDPLEPEDLNEHFGQYDNQIIQKQKLVRDGRVYEITDQGGGGGGGDNWGSQTVVSDPTLKGAGTTGSPLGANINPESENILGTKSGAPHAGKLQVKLRTRQLILNVTALNTIDTINEELSALSRSSMVLNTRGMVYDQGSPTPMFTVASGAGITTITMISGIPDLPAFEPGDRVVAIFLESYN